MPTDTTSAPPNSPLALQTISSEGEEPKSRISSAKDALSIFESMRHSAEDRLRRAQVIMGMFDGNPPYSTSKKRQAGQMWMANFNTLEGAARKDAAKVPYYDLFSSAQLFAECRTDVSTDTISAEEATRIRSEEFDRLLRSWPSFTYNVWMMLDDFVGYNKGFFWWPQRDSWHFKRIPWHRVYFPNGTTVDTDEWELFAIEHSFPVHKLWGMVKDASTASAAGWNRDQVIKAIRAAAPKDQGSNANDPIALQQSLHDSDLYTSTKSATVQAASIYFREFDGKWSRIIVATETTTGEVVPTAESPAERAARMGKVTERALGHKDWLFRKDKVADSVHELVAPFFFELGDGSVNALEGLGKRIVSIMQLKDRIRNEQANNVLLRSTVVLKPTTASSTMKSGLMHFGGGLTVLPNGYEVQQATIFGDIEGSLAVNNDLDRMLDTNTGIYRPQFEKPTGNPESATAANIRFSQATILNNSAVQRFYQQLDGFYAELYRRASMPLSNVRDLGVQAAREFQKRCRERGLSNRQIEDLDSFSITAVRTIGNGSPVMRQQMVGSMLNFAPSFGQRGYQNYLEDAVAAFGGQSKVERWLPRADIQNIPSQDDWEATRENNDMQQGAPPLLTDEQNHEVHAIRHFQAGVQAFQAVQQGADPTTAFIFLQLAIPHIQEHIPRIGREQNRKQLEQGLRELEKMFRQVEQAVSQMQQQQQEASNLTFEQQMKMQDMLADNQRKDMKAQQQFETKGAQAQQSLAIKDATTAADIRRKDAATAAEIERKRAEAVNNNAGGDE